MRASTIIVSLILLMSNIAGQNKNSDSLRKLINSSDLRVKYNALKYYGSGFRHTIVDSALFYHQKALVLAKRIDQIEEGECLIQLAEDWSSKADYNKAIELSESGYNLGKRYINDKNTRKRKRAKTLIAKTLRNIGNAYFQLGKNDIAKIKYKESWRINEEIGNTSDLGVVLCDLGELLQFESNYPEALKIYLKALVAIQKEGTKQNEAAILGSIGSLYAQQNLPDKAKEFLMKSIIICREINFSVGEAVNLSNLANLLKDEHKYDEALKYYFDGLTILQKIDAKTQMASALQNIGAVYSDDADFNNKQYTLKEQQNKYKLSTRYSAQALELNKQAGYKFGMTINMGEMGSAYIKLKSYSLAEKYLFESLNLANEINFKDYIKQLHNYFTNLYEVTGRSKLALKHYKLFIQYRDSIFNEENTRKTIQQEVKYNYDMKAATDSLKTVEEKRVSAAQLAASIAKLKQEKILKYSLSGGLLILVIVVVLIYNRFKITQKQKYIIEQKEIETKLQNEIITQQKHLVEEKHKEITDSINYAERIQRSFLATKELLDANLPEYFILFKPKDIVSGDFYWASKLSDNNFALVTADSTGHGVPGAIMSLLNITSLEKAIELYSEPAEILNCTRTIIIDRLRKDGSSEGGKDGMDCSLCAFDFKNKILFVASANNPVWIVRGNEVIEIKPDKMPMGKHEKDGISFIQHQIILQSGDVIYTLTDGYPDQFGGEKGKKFMSKNLKALLMELSKKPMIEQKDILETTFRNWAGNLEQVDDVTVIGLRVPE